MLKDNKGITLIALVITIIVLLILAGVSIAILTGSNGILTQAQNAANTTLYSSVLAQEIPTEFTQEDFNLAKENLGTDYTVTPTIPTTGTGTAIQRVGIRHEKSSLAGYIRITDQKSVEIQYVN